MGIPNTDGERLVRNKTRIEICDLVDGGYGGGVVCVAELPHCRDVLALSITHLRFDLGHPLYREIRAYQIHRIKETAAVRLRERA